LLALSCLKAAKMGYLTIIAKGLSVFFVIKEFHSEGLHVPDDYYKETNSGPHI
jgi:hypothetical protein